MKSVVEQISVQTERFRMRPLFDVMDRKGRPSEVRSLVSSLTFFVFAFQDVLRINEERVADPRLRQIAKVHRREDAGHDIWFLNDMEKLEAKRDVRWVFGPEHQLVRECSFEVVAEALRAEDDATRIALLLALESAGHVFFGKAFPFCEDVGTDLSLEYFSRPHWEVEVDHDVFGQPQLDLLEGIGLSTLERDRSSATVERVFAALTRMVDHFYDGILAAADVRASGQFPIGSTAAMGAPLLAARRAGNQTK